MCAGRLQWLQTALRTRSDPMQIMKLGSFPIEQERDLDSLERRLGGWFASRTYPTRLITFSRRFDLRPAITPLTHDQRDLTRLARCVTPLLTAIDDLLSGVPGADPAAVVQRMASAELGLLLDLFAADPLLQRVLLDPTSMGADSVPMLWGIVADVLASLLWRLPWQKEMLRFYSALSERHLRSALHLMLTWEPPDVSGQAIADTLEHEFGRKTTILDHLPSILDGAYQVDEARARLVPEEYGRPYYTVLQSYDMRGVWDATTLHPLLSGAHDVAVAIDVHTLSRNKAMRMAELAYNTARMLAKDQQIIDMRAQRVKAAAEYVMHEVVRQSLHQVQIAVLVGGATPEELETNAQSIQERCGTQLRLMRVAGAQGELIKLFSTTPAQQIDAPWKRRDMLSQGVGCCAGIVGYHRASNTSGILYGLDAVRRAPLFFNLFANNQAAHQIVLGKTGFGKTVYLNLMAVRGAALAGYRVIGIDAFRNGERVAAAAGAGARCHSIGLNQTINILDIIYDEASTEGHWAGNQIQQVIGALSLLMGTPGKSADNKDRYIPRIFLLEERGVLERTLMTLYRNVSPSSSLTAMPILSDLIAVLEARVQREARNLARQLRMLLFGSDDVNETEPTVLGQAFNGHTTVDWNFQADINYFDFSQVPEILRPLYYAMAIGAVLRYMRDPLRDKRRKTLLQIDEFGYLMQLEELAHLAATICKVARKYAIGLTVIDQNPLTFLGSETGRSIFENAVAKILFHLDDLPARQMGEAISDLTPAHVEFLTQARPGECVAVVNNDVYVMHAEANPKEARAFVGS